LTWSGSTEDVCSCVGTCLLGQHCHIKCLPSRCCCVLALEIIVYFHVLSHFHYVSSFDGYKILSFLSTYPIRNALPSPKNLSKAEPHQSTTMPSFGRKPKSDQGDKRSQDSHLTFDDKEKPVSPSRSKQEVQTGQVRPRPMRFAPSSEWNERQKLLDHSRRSLSGFVNFFKEDELMVDKCGYCNNYCRRLPNGQDYCDYCTKNGFL